MITRSPSRKRTPCKYPVVDGVQYGPGDHEICLDTAAGNREYKRRTGIMAERQLNLCAICRLWMERPTFDHALGRGANKRDDRIWKEGATPEDRLMNAALCLGCQGIKGSRMYEWKFGVYVPIN